MLPQSPTSGSWSALVPAFMLTSGDSGPAAPAGFIPCPAGSHICWWVLKSSLASPSSPLHLPAGVVAWPGLVCPQFMFVGAQPSPAQPTPSPGTNVSWLVFQPDPNLSFSPSLFSDLPLGFINWPSLAYSQTWPTHLPAGSITILGWTAPSLCWLVRTMNVFTGWVSPKTSCIGLPVASCSVCSVICFHHFSSSS